MSKGTLFVVSAPSGCGKGTILEQILKDDSNVFYSVSATTRKPREGEVDGVNYYFKTKDEFMELVNNNGMLEYASFCDNYYGTPRKEVEEKLENGFDVILEIETQGAMNIRKACPEAVLIFILPPSVSELRRRLHKRGTEADDVIEKRVGEAKNEISKSKAYDYVMINADLEKAILDMKSIINAQRLKVNKMYDNINEVLENA